MHDVQRFRAALALSEKMLDAAKLEELSALQQLERERHDLFPRHPLGPGHPDKHEITLLIKQIQKCDNEVLEYLSMQREHIRILLRLPAEESRSP